MVLLPKIQEGAIVENLKKRYMDDLIFVSFCYRSQFLCEENFSVCPPALCIFFGNLNLCRASYTYHCLHFSVSL